MLAGSISAQKDPVTAIFEKYSGKEGFTVVNISGDMLNMMAQARAEQGDTLFRSKLTELKILAVEKCTDQAQTVNFRTELVDKLDRSVYKEMMTVKQSDEDVLILIRESKGRISEFLVVVAGSDDNVIIQGKGDMLMSEMSQMAGSFPMKGLEHLKELEK
jgi:hypothetical protein